VHWRGAKKRFCEPPPTFSVHTTSKEIRLLVTVAVPIPQLTMAVSVGNVHRLKEPGATIDYGRLAQIQASVKVPLVIHGTSGLFDEDIVRLTRTRVAKFNIGTVLRQAFGRGLRETLARHPDRFDRLDIMRDAMPTVSREAMRMIQLLGWSCAATGPAV